LEFFSVGGGLGIVYDQALASGPAHWWKGRRARHILTPALYAERLVPLLKPLGLRILIEPGRFIVGNAGILVTRVEYIKRTGRKNFVIVDAAMNDLIRPAFYDSYHEIVPVQRNGKSAVPPKSVRVDVVGPICESGDYFAKDRPLPAIAQGDYLALLSAGAYGSVMASNYNSRALSAEVLVNGNKAALVRSRQPLEQIWDLESLPPWLR
jgi:diaminopimelate decarboxylase